MKLSVAFASALVFLFCGGGCASHTPRGVPAPSVVEISTAKERAAYRSYIHQITTTLIRKATHTEYGPSWLSIPDEDKPEETQDFYDGNSGIAYFLLKAYLATGEAKDLDEARQALQHIWSQAKKDAAGPFYDEVVNGLFEGNAGPAYVFLYAYHVTGDRTYLTYAAELADRILEVPDTGENGSVDIISGASGSGLFLLKLYEVTKDRRYLTGAEQLGDFLVLKAELVGDGAKWPLTWRGSGRVGHYPGFSHGVAGIGYFLDRLSRVSKNPVYAEFAGRAHRYLQDIAISENGYVKWFTDDAKFKERFAAQWCHGVGGMTPFFVGRFRTTGNPENLSWATNSTSYLLDRGVNNNKDSAGVCHGISGNAASIFMIYRETRNPRYVEEIRTAVRLLDETAERGGDHVYWRSPGFKADYSYMTGIAGVGDFFVLLYSGGDLNMMTGLGFGDDF